MNHELNKQLCDAVTRSHYSDCLELLRAGADPNTREQITQNPILHIATALTDPRILNLLINAGADIKDSLGRSPLHIATRGKLQASINVLIDAGCDPRTRGGSIPRLASDFLDSIEDAEFNEIKKKLSEYELSYSDSTRKKADAECMRKRNTFLDTKKTEAATVSFIKIIDNERFKKIFNFESYERITILKNKLGGDVAMDIQPFSEVQNDPELKIAFDRCVQAGYRPEEEKVFITVSVNTPTTPKRISMKA